ncbi:sporulation protein [Paenibacillus yanchengensis]|uniref:Sporulation protein n=1 Tax=Paenibacillus yanchengensis TaxID=2035833 RepID=A0ABW4YN67_9BACL
MTLFKKMLASAGIGAANVDLILERDHVQAGETIHGVVRIQGGRVDQHVDDIYAFLKTRYIKEQSDSKVSVDATIAKYQLAGKFTVLAEQRYEFPVTMKLPDILPATIGKTPVWFQTGLDIKEAIDPQDNDYLSVAPHPHVAVVLDAVQQMGFRMHEVSCKEVARRFRVDNIPFVQEFEFIPTAHYRNVLDELEFMFYPNASGIEMLVQIDRRARGLSGWLAEAADMDESYVTIRFDRQELANGSSYIAQQLAAHINKYT